MTSVKRNSFMLRWLRQLRPHHVPGRGSDWIGGEKEDNEAIVNQTTQNNAHRWEWRQVEMYIKTNKQTDSRRQSIY